MKKYFFLIAVMVVVFLGWGNVAMGQLTNCEDGTTYCDPTTLQCNCNAFNAGTLGFCTCVDVSPPPTSPPVDEETEPSCEIENSQYYQDNNATVSTIGFSCKCKPGYGDMPGNKNPFICQPCDLKDVCCGIQLNTSIPFIGNCLEDVKYGGVSGEKAFPVLMGALTQILVTVILIVSFILIIIGGIMISTGNPSGGKKMIIKVVVGIAILGASGVILRLINPNFFG